MRMSVQVINSTPLLASNFRTNTSLGDLKPNLIRVQLSNRLTILLICTWVIFSKLIILGKYCLN